MITDELARHDAAGASVPVKGAAARQVLNRFHGSGLVIVLAFGQILAFEQRFEA